MRLFFIFLISFCFSVQHVEAQAKKAFAIYNRDGETINYSQLLNAFSDTDIILFGEEHNSALIHWLQYELISDLFVKEADLGIGMEMFSPDQQSAVNDYLAGDINFKALRRQVDLWPNFKTDYLQILTFAKTHNLSFRGTNAPQQIARNVYKKGGFSYLDELSDQQLSYLPPRPIPFDPNLPGYKKMKKMMGLHANDDIVKAQALKDATMAHQLTQLAAKNALVLHINGKYHSDNFDGIFWYLQQYQPALKVKTISMVHQADIFSIDKANLEAADFIICIDQNMTKTY
ncbi:MAG: ChaN family lipoprotein [Psychroflexus sp.]|jgi:uncharacterized iron-regulated protein|nr:ChaN family lipoprotein [Psychroflexus sp.]MDR9449386.1 ChaN family lipoprotein [Psychroflexus sp.]